MNITTVKFYMATLLTFLLLLSCSPKIPEQMVFVEGSSFVMGDDINHAQYPVILSDYYILQHEVTNAEFADMLNWAYENKLLITDDKFIRTMPYKDFKWDLYHPERIGAQITMKNGVFTVNKGKEDHPVVCVSWYGAVAYCNYLSIREGRTELYDLHTWEYDKGKRDGYRLPTNEEWEYAARGGKKLQSFIYSGGEKANEVAWNYNNSSNEIHPVKLLKPNSLKIYDMSGNVWEFTAEKMGYFPGDMTNNQSGTDTQSTQDGVNNSENNNFYKFIKIIRQFAAERISYFPEDMTRNLLGTSYRAARGGAYNLEDINLYKFIVNIDYPNFLKGYNDIGFRYVYVK